MAKNNNKRGSIVVSQRGIAEGKPGPIRVFRSVWKSKLVEFDGKQRKLGYTETEDLLSPLAPNATGLTNDEEGTLVMKGLSPATIQSVKDRIGELAIRRIAPIAGRRLTEAAFAVKVAIDAYPNAEGEQRVAFEQAIGEAVETVKRQSKPAGVEAPKAGAGHAAAEAALVEAFKRMTAETLVLAEWVKHLTPSDKAQVDRKHPLFKERNDLWKALGEVLLPELQSKGYALKPETKGKSKQPAAAPAESSQAKKAKKSSKAAESSTAEAAA